MSDPDFKDRMNELAKRLETVRGKRDAEAAKKGKRKQSGVGFAYRIGLELVAAVAVGGLIGWAIDRWLGTAPWFMILFFILGVAAGFVNVYKAAGKSDSGASSGE